MAPEQARQQTVDRRADVFSLGVVLYELLTDRKPFTGSTLSEITTAVIEHKPPRADEVDPGVPAALAEITARGELLLLDLGEKGYQEKVAPRSTAPRGTVLTLASPRAARSAWFDTSGTAQAFVVAADAVAEEAPELAMIGLDPVADPVSWTSFARALLARNVKLKALLMDQEVVAGIGPIYSDEILWEAGLRYDRISSELSSQEIRRLFRALVETLHDAVKHRGTTVDDHPFVDLYGKPGDHQDELKVYGREGEPCRRCRAAVAKARFANKPVFFWRLRMADVQSHYRWKAPTKTPQHRS